MAPGVNAIPFDHLVSGLTGTVTKVKATITELVEHLPARQGHAARGPYRPGPHPGEQRGTNLRTLTA